MPPKVLLVNAKKYSVSVSVIAGGAGVLATIDAKGKVHVWTPEDDPRLGRVLAGPAARLQKAMDGVVAALSKM